MRGCVANTALSRIEKYDSSGTYVTGWGGAGSADGQFNLPQAVAVDGSGNIYVADTGHDRILVFGALGTPTPTSTPTATSVPGVIAVSDAAGTLAGTQAGITFVNNDPPSIESASPSSISATTPGLPRLRRRGKTRCPSPPLGGGSTCRRSRARGAQLHFGCGPCAVCHNVDFGAPA